MTKIKLKIPSAAETGGYLFERVSQAVAEEKKKNGNKEFYSLGVGDVSVPVNPVVVNAMKAAADDLKNAETFHGYAPAGGYAFLKSAVRAFYVERGARITESDVYISDGAKTDFAAIFDLFGDSPVYLPSPAYPAYKAAAAYRGAPVYELPTRPEDGFIAHPPRHKITGVFILCTPNNPTGACFTRANFKEWISYALKTGSLLIFDTAYFLWADESAFSPFQFDGARACCVEISSLSKSDSFTGVRAGFTLIPQELTASNRRVGEAFLKRQASRFNGVSYVAQRAAEAALSEESAPYRDAAVKAYRENARLITDVLKKRGAFYVGGDTSPYVFAKTPAGVSSEECFYDLLKRGVVATPGGGFGRGGEGFMRYSALASKRTVKCAARILDAYYKEKKN